MASWRLSSRRGRVGFDQVLDVLVAAVDGQGRLGLLVVLGRRKPRPPGFLGLMMVGLTENLLELNLDFIAGVGALRMDLPLGRRDVVGEVEWALVGGVDRGCVVGNWTMMLPPLGTMYLVLNLTRRWSALGADASKEKVEMGL